MFKLPNNYPNFRADVSDIADFYESECLKSDHHHTSFREIYRIASQGEDEIEINGIEDDDDRFNNDKFDAVCTEIERRITACGGKYPFLLEENGHVLRLRFPFENWLTIAYAYLLLATRLNMRDNRTHNGIDGTLLFEKISNYVATTYWGERSEGLVFGTANPGSFSDKVEDLCQKIGEGRGFRNRDEINPTAQDDKLDIVVWKSFQDSNPSKLIGFGQCKTGTHWEQLTTQLQPTAFCKSWLDTQPVIDPIRIFFISDSFFIQQQYSKSTYAGLVFDRFRIMDFLPTVFDEQIGLDVKSWVEAALLFIKAQ